MSLSKEQITEIAATISVDFASLAAFMEVESSGKGFSPVTGKIIIQFEPHIFAKGLQTAKVDYTMTVAVENGRKKYTISSGGKTIVNSVEGQTAEWVAFDTATAIHARSAKMSTSIGLGQVMGFNHGKLGFKTVEEMWSEFEKGEYQQVVGMTFFIKNTPGLLDALKAKNWAKVAKLYNGADYAINKYDVKLATAYAKYKLIQDSPAAPARSFGSKGASAPVGGTAEMETSDEFIVPVESVLSAHSFLLVSEPEPIAGTKKINARSAKPFSKGKLTKPASRTKQVKQSKFTDKKVAASKAVKTKSFAKSALKQAPKSASKTALKQAPKSAPKTALKQAPKPAPKPSTSKKATAPKKPAK